MWTSIKDCGKQLTINDKIREGDDIGFKLYKIAEVEFDQYKLVLLEKDGVVVTDEVTVILPCSKIVEYNFEVETIELK
jgi:hypothetical protein